jgi:hypothetical protein
MNIFKKIFIGMVVLAGLTALPAASFADVETYTVTIKDHKFLPAELTIPANTKIKITVENQDPTPEEFESYDLNREKVVAAHGKIIVFIGPVKAGKYKFFGDFHQDQAQGTIIAQ